MAQMRCAVALCFLLARFSAAQDAPLTFASECRQQAVEWCRINVDPNSPYGDPTDDVWTISSAYVCCHRVTAGVCDQYTARHNELSMLFTSCSAACLTGGYDCQAGLMSLDRSFKQHHQTHPHHTTAKRSTIGMAGASAHQGVPLVNTPIVHSQWAVFCPKKNGKVCNSQGTCEAQKCKCYDGWFGAACQLKHCPNYIQKGKPTNPFALPTKAKRVVYPQGSGFDGGLTSPSDFIECSGHGHCHHEGLITGRVGQGVERLLRLGLQARRPGWDPDRNSAGTCECVPPYFGADCSQLPCPVYEGRICNDQGSCDTKGRGTTIGPNWICNCRWPFFGSSCEFIHCPTKAGESSSVVAMGGSSVHHHARYIECSGHGTCHHETGYAALQHNIALGTRASTQLYTDQSTRAWGNLGHCECHEPYYGKDCSLKRCASIQGVECSGKGTCRTGAAWSVCECIPGYEGPACEHKNCPMFNTFPCGGTRRGHCHQATGTCHCELGYFHIDCSQGTGADGIIDL